MKKQLHILQGFIILTIILIFGLLSIKFIYHIRHEKLDTTYMWNIDFENLQVSEGSKEGNLTINDNEVSLDVELDNENEFYEFTIDVTNNGTLDAKISDLFFNIENDKNILKYSLTYLDDRQIAKDDILASKEKKTIKVKVYYPIQTNKVYEALNLKLSFRINYTAII